MDKLTPHQNFGLIRSSESFLLCKFQFYFELLRINLIGDLTAREYFYIINFIFELKLTFSQ